METRRELFVYGNLPFAATLPHIETTTALVSVLNKLLQVATRSDGQPSCTCALSCVSCGSQMTPKMHAHDCIYHTTGFVQPSSVADLLDIPLTFAEVLVMALMTQSTAA